MKKITVVGRFAVLLCLVGGAAAAEEMLVGISFFIDDAGKAYPKRGYGPSDSEVPFLILLDFSEDYTKAKMYFETEYKSNMEIVSVEGLDDESPLHSFVLKSEQYGDIDFFLGDEVTADELEAVVASYKVSTGEKWYTAVGVIAAKEFQKDDEQVGLFDEIIDEFMHQVETTE